ncbi:hypothetical protein [Sporichthya sp.]|uniref:hypothetical protein n=1 Tax=Sporichthya sp. TaxID=65475 RepID=UPI0017F53A10|nr:hypothetical protein [Sporichthya sp.]MBA3743343.1 hypothetical protein [Sporichthya sp.]
MVQGDGLHPGDVHIEVTGIRTDDSQGLPHVGARIMIRLSADAFDQLVERKVVGAKAGRNLVVTQHRAEIRDAAGQLSIVEVDIGRDG